MAARTRTPLWVGEFDLADPPAVLVGETATPDGTPYDQARLLVRFRGEPLGMLTVPLLGGEVDIGAVRSVAADRFAPIIDAVGGSGWDLDGDRTANLTPELQELSASGSLPAVSVVIGTRNRPDHVVACIDRVLKQPYPSPVEVIVVDNGSVDSATGDALRAHFGNDDRVRFMIESRPGLSRARNIGLSAARYPVTAFLSDDIRVDPIWLLAIARGFARDPEVRCVTGICPPLYLDTDEQLQFESAMAWGTRQGFRPVLHAFVDDDDPLHPYRAGSFVNGSNMAYDTETFRRLGGFDESLGPGTIARGGEDLDAPIRILVDGGLVAFEPAALGWHADRYDDRPFSAHMYTYGLGLTAFLTKHVVDPAHRRAVLERVRHGLPLLAKAFVEPDHQLRHEVAMPLRYHLWQLVGRAVGPVAYLRSRRARRR